MWVAHYTDSPVEARPIFVEVLCGSPITLRWLAQCLLKRVVARPNYTEEARPLFFEVRC